jgi:hypothetical protein
MKKPVLLAFLLLASGALIAIPSVTHQARGQFTGTVCLVATGSTACPSSPPTISGTVGTQLRVAVFLQTSDGINGFDITLLADHTIVKPAGADLTGTVLQPPQQIIEECIGGRLVVGNTCQSTDTVDTIHFVALNCLGCPNTPTPTTGLLFTAIYNVTGATTGTPLGYQTGCTGTSVPGTCITLVNGSAAPVPENAQGATFVTTGDFAISASPTSLTIPRGGSASSTISLSSLAGFAGTISLSTTVSPSVGHGPVATLSPTSITLSSGGTGSSSLTVSTARHTPTGTYTVTVTGTSGNVSHSVTVTVTVTR